MSDQLKLYVPRGVAERVTPEVVERRDPRAATLPTSYITPGRPTMPRWDSSAATEYAYYANVTVWACIQAIANDLSRLPFRAGVNPEDPGSFDPGAPLARFLSLRTGRPNPQTSPRRLIAWTVVQRFVTGHWAWEVEQAPRTGDVVALWPLVSRFLKPQYAESGPRWFSGFVYGGHGMRGREVTLRPEQVVYDWLPRADDYRQPESPLEAAQLDVSVAVMQDRYDWAFLRNDARPAAIIVHEAFDSRDERDAWRRQFEHRHQGPANAGKIGWIEADPDGSKPNEAIYVQQLGLSQTDMQALERYEVKLQGIRAALGVPKTRLMDAANRTFANASEEMEAYWQNTIWPLAEELAEAINMQLAPRVGSEVGWFDFSEVDELQQAVRKTTTQAVGAPALVQAQLMTINEARADYGLPPIEGGDRVMTAEEIQALKGGGVEEGRSPFLLVRPVPEAPPLPPVQDDERGVAGAGYREGSGVSATASPTPAAPVPDATVEPVPIQPAPVASESREEPDPQVRRTKIWRDTDRQVRALEAVWERQMRALFRRQAGAVVARLTGKRGRQAVERRTDMPDTDALFDRAFWIAETRELAEGLYESVALVAGSTLVERFELGFDVVAPHVEEFVAARANQLAGLVTDTTYHEIQQALIDGVAEGEAIPDLARRVRDVFDQADRVRSVRIARTEVISAYNGAATTVAVSLPGSVVAAKEWISTTDARTRDSHAERNGEVVGVADPFSGGLFYPGDPSGGPEEVVNCRCTVAYLTEAEIPGGVLRSAPYPVAVGLLALVRPGHTADELRRAWRTATEVAA